MSKEVIPDNPPNNSGWFRQCYASDEVILSRAKEILHLAIRDTPISNYLSLDMIGLRDRTEKHTIERAVWAAKRVLQEHGNSALTELVVTAIQNCGVK